MGILNRRFARSCFYDSKVDDESIEWLTLNNSVSWDEPKSIGKEKYQYKLKDMMSLCMLMRYLLNSKILNKQFNPLKEGTYGEGLSFRRMIGSIW